MEFVAKLMVRQLEEEDAYQEELRDVFRMYDKEVRRRMYCKCPVILL